MQGRFYLKKVYFLAIFLFSFQIIFGMNEDDSKKVLETDSVYSKAKSNFENYATNWYKKINDTTLTYDLFKQGLIGYLNLAKRNELPKDNYFTLIDFSKPSSQERLYIFDVCLGKIIYKSLVSHGKNSGGLYADKFSNKENSHQSSLGFYVTGSTYTSKKYDLALRLNGMESSNSHASSRGVVMHGADYVSCDFLENYGMIGRSYGCPAMPFENFDKIVSWLKEGTCIYIYYPNSTYQRYSKYLNRKDYLTSFI